MYLRENHSSDSFGGAGLHQNIEREYSVYPPRAEDGGELSAGREFGNGLGAF